MKGSIFDLVMIIPIIFAIGITVIFSHYILTEWDAQYDQPRSETFNQTITRGKEALATFDYSIVFVAVSLSLIVVIFSFLVNSHPIFFVFSFLALSIFVVLSVLFSNIFGEIIAQSMLVPSANQFPILVLFLQNLPKISLLMGALIAIAMYAKGSKSPI